MKNMNINEVLEVKGANIIDVREPQEYAMGSLPGAKNIPMMGLMMNAGEFLDKNEKYYIMCQAGGRSMQVCTNLQSQGYDVVNLTGGYSAFEE